MQTQTSDSGLTGVVYKKTLGHYDVHHDGQVISCTLSSKLWKDFEMTRLPDGRGQRVRSVSKAHMDPIAIGDRVSYTPTPDGAGVIETVLPRKNYLARASAKPMPTAHTFEQVIAANVDRVVPVFAAANPEPKWHMLDRYLASAEAHCLPSHVIITKLDLVQGSRAENKLLEAVERYRQIGYPVLLTSVVDQQGIEEMRDVLAGQVSVMVGKSGVGKSSLLNAIEPGLGLRVHAVSEVTGKGRHTTTHYEMFPLATGGALVDTPGVREFGLWGQTPEEIADCFIEMRPLIGQCRFGLSCQHDEEPGCAIKQAVMDGLISPYRYKSYLRLKADL
jgi:ribosome biogenesis GTPase